MHFCKIRSIAKKKLVLALILAVSVSIIFNNVEFDNDSFQDAFSNQKIETVIIDAGHGGEDCGAIGITGVLEKDLNFSVALIVGEGLRASGYNVIYTRTEDKMLYKDEENIKGLRKISDLKNRAAIANSISGSIFVSIHMNSYSESKYSGLQVYYSGSEDESRNLAQKIQTKVKVMLQPNNKRAIKEGKGIYLLEKIASVAVLIECGFLSNFEECEKLSEKEYQKQLSFSIICGIIEYINQTNEEMSL